MTEDDWGRGWEKVEKKISGGFWHENIGIHHLKNIFWPLGCLKIAKFWKIKENWKILIFQLLRAVAPKGKMQIGWFFAQWFTRPVWKRWWKKFPKLCAVFEKNWPLQKVHFLKNLFFKIFKILGVARQKVYAPSPTLCLLDIRLIWSGEAVKSEILHFLDERRPESKNCPTQFSILSQNFEVFSKNSNFLLFEGPNGHKIEF